MTTQDAIVYVQINGQAVPIALIGLPYMLSGSVKGCNGSIKTSYHFLVGGAFNESIYWHPWSFSPVGLEPFVSLLTDKKLQDLILAFGQIDEQFRQHMQEWAIALANFFDYTVPPTETVYRKIIRKRRAYQESQTPVWMLQVEFQNLSLQLQEIVKTSETMTLQIMEQIRRVYQEYETPEALGDQRAKDLIDRANEQPGISAQQATKLLKKALRYGTTGIQASKAYMRLAMWYEDLGDTAKAIEHYGLSMNAWREYPYAYFVCGRLYHEQQRYTEALNSIRKALEFPLDEWGEVEDYEKAKQLLRTLESYI